MPKNILYLTGLVLVSLFSGCSFITNFYIFNLSDNQIEIEYSIATNTYLLTSNPIVLELNKSNIGDSIRTVYSENLTVKFTLDANQALYLGNDVNFFIENDIDAQNLNAAFMNFEIITENDTIKIDSDAVSYFSEVNRHTIALILE